MAKKSRVNKEADLRPAQAPPGQESEEDSGEVQEEESRDDDFPEFDDGDTEIDFDSLDEDQKLWARYAQTSSQEDRDLLIERYIKVVNQVAERIATKLPPYVEVDDLKQAGCFGLVDAVGKFDYTRGIKFETYAANRVRGSILDFLRDGDWVPRQIRNKRHQLDRARDELETSLQREATDEELASHLEMKMEDYYALLKELDIKSMVSLDRKWDDGDDSEMGHLETLQDKSSCDPLDEIQRQEIKALALRGLSDKEQAVLVMYYYDNMSLKEIGAVLEISESRVCQIHQQTLELLRDKFTARDVVFH